MKSEMAVPCVSPVVRSVVAGEGVRRPGWEGHRNKACAPRNSHWPCDARCGDEGGGRPVCRLPFFVFSFLFFFVHIPHPPPGPVLRPGACRAAVHSAREVTGEEGMSGRALLAAWAFPFLPSSDRAESKRMVVEVEVDAMRGPSFPFYRSAPSVQPKSGRVEKRGPPGSGLANKGQAGNYWNRRRWGTRAARLPPGRCSLSVR